MKRQGGTGELFVFFFFFVKEIFKGNLHPNILQSLRNMGFVHEFFFFFFLNTIVENVKSIYKNIVDSDVLKNISHRETKFCWR